VPLTAALLLLMPGIVRAQPPPTSDHPFARRAWNLQLAAHAAFETWTSNRSHENLYAIVPGITYAVRDGVMITATWPLYYVSQRGANGYVLGATIGARRRVYRRGAYTVFLGLEAGISQADTYVPPGGTRFNYLALGSAGATARLRHDVHLLASVTMLHLSNANLAGHGRNPDIEAIGPQLGLLLGF
jgi:hypothetical protein